MNKQVKLADYFYTRVKDTPGHAYKLLEQLTSEAVNLLAFSAVPFGPNHIEFTLFPKHSEALLRAAEKLNWTLGETQHAFLVQGDDHLGALAGLHQKLADAQVNVYASSGVTDGQGRFGYVIYIKEADVDLAAQALGADLTI